MMENIDTLQQALNFVFNIFILGFILCIKNKQLQAFILFNISYTYQPS